MGDVRRLGGPVGEEHANSWGCRRSGDSPGGTLNVGQEHPIRRRSSTLGTSTLRIITHRRDRYGTTYQADGIAAVVLLNRSIPHPDFCRGERNLSHFKKSCACFSVAFACINRMNSSCSMRIDSRGGTAIPPDATQPASGKADGRRCDVLGYLGNRPCRFAHQPDRFCFKFFRAVPSGPGSHVAL